MMKREETFILAGSASMICCAKLAIRARAPSLAALSLLKTSSSQLLGMYKKKIDRNLLKKELLTVCYSIRLNKSFPIDWIYITPAGEVGK